ncbi:MAG: hypothetical protein AAGK78_15170 [Planctomycetota bacterium]
MLALLINVAAGWFMVGLIWIIQVVHYAQFNLIGETNWAAYHQRHVTMITPVVGPMMLVELLSAIALLVRRPEALPAWIAWVSAALVLAMWVSTAAIQVPLHNKLAAGFDQSTYAALVNTNWLRTAGWSLRALLVTWGLWLVMTKTA